MGYRKDVAYSHSDEYKSYKALIRYAALGAGLARLPKTIDNVIPHLSVFINWRGKARLDWDNVVKAIQDALWRNDRDVDPGSFRVYRNTGSAEYAYVMIDWYV
jgi:hypothetical protein